MKAQGKKILVADCHEDVLIVLEKLLEDAGFDTTTVWTAKDALSLVDSHAFDLVLVNRHLPDLECEEVLRELRKRGVTCVVILPSPPDMTDFTSLEALGACGVVCKHAYREVVETVSECLACGRKTLSAA